MSKTFINLTPHVINLNDGRSFAPSSDYPAIRIPDKIDDTTDPDFATVVAGEVENLPPVEEGVYYIVSRMVAEKLKNPHFVSPATNHPKAVRNDAGHIVSVPCFFTFPA